LLSIVVQRSTELLFLHQKMSVPMRLDGDLEKAVRPNEEENGSPADLGSRPEKGRCSGTFLGLADAIAFPFRACQDFVRHRAEDRLPMVHVQIPVAASLV
jgi:hypothetical protein